VRPIDFDAANLPLPNGWAEKAAELSTALVGQQEVEGRNAIIDANQIWSELKPLLRELSHGKCWYTESPQQGTDVDVDHFRPKKRVAELVESENPHPGYWWLAFAPSNYRYSCIVANRRRRDVATGHTGGKADHFPLSDEADRAGTPEANCDAERPLLIDPCKPGDPQLIAFKEDGEAMPRFPEEQKYKYNKADISITLYNINHSEFVNARIALLDQIERLRRDAQRFYARLETGDADHEEGYRRAITELAKLRAPNAPYSAFCSAMMDRYRHEDYMYGLYV
jgi:hypothetical protein